MTRFLKHNEFYMNLGGYPLGLLINFNSNLLKMVLNFSSIIFNKMLHIRKEREELFKVFISYKPFRFLPLCG